MDLTLTVLAWNLAAVLGLMAGAWVLSMILEDASIADVVWGLGFVLVAWVTFFLADGGYLPRKLLITSLVTVWGLRLAIHIGWRKRGKGEDRRYRAWRAKYGKRFRWVSLFTVFGLQGLLLWVISLSVQAGQIPGGSLLGVLDAAGLALWCVGFAFEAVGDAQLARFKADPSNRGQVMDRGLWAYTRHPNYFGESLMWWGLFGIALSAPGNLWTVVSPITITFLLLKVSGVTLLEKSIEETRPAYRDYQERTSAFLPWFPGRKRS